MTARGFAVAEQGAELLPLPVLPCAAAPAAGERPPVRQAPGWDSHVWFRGRLWLSSVPSVTCRQPEAVQEMGLPTAVALLHS